ncbi:MAG TPA: hypothetical protein VD967_01870 [Candidatus Paceibacterota bacterium]|nr:hypothetical protein [Candidatus Paceibacterota bacterium]
MSYPFAPSALKIALDASKNITSIVMPRWSNFHAHLRVGDLMRAIAGDIMRSVKYLLVMPNTGPVDTVEKILAYHATLMALAEELGLKPTLVMTLYLTDRLTPAMVQQLARLPFKVGVKYYPPHKGATTGSGMGVPLSMVKDGLKEMAICDIPLLGHFTSIFDKDGRPLPLKEQEGYFMQHEFDQLREENPDLRINIEHVSTRLGIEKVRKDLSGKTTCGITPHHMFLTLSWLNKQSWAIHGHCMPILQEEEDVYACNEFGTSGDKRAHAGDDTAAHLLEAKKNGATGCFLPHSLAMYVHNFLKAKALDERFVNFMCYNGPDSWGLSRPDLDDTVTLVADTENDIPEPTRVPSLNDVIIPLGHAEAGLLDRLRIGFVCV